MSKFFDGVNDFGVTSFPIGTCTRLALSYWLRWNAYANDNDIALESAIGANFLADNGVAVRPNDASGEYGVLMAAGGIGVLYRFPRPTAGEWHHFLHVWDRNLAAGAEIVSYVDGALVAATPSVNNAAGTFSAGSLFVMSRVGTSAFGNGTLADLAAWFHQMPNAIDARLLASGARASSPSLSVRPSCYWPLDHGSGAPRIGPGAIAWTGAVSGSPPPRLQGERGPVFAPGAFSLATLGAAVGGAGAPPPSSGSDGARWRGAQRDRFRW